jgi:hypothetical protein
MSTLSSERGVTTLTFGVSDTQVEVNVYDGLDYVRVSVGSGPISTDVRFRTGNPGVAAKLAQMFAEAARSQGYTDSLTF